MIIFGEEREVQVLLVEGEKGEGVSRKRLAVDAHCEGGVFASEDKVVGDEAVDKGEEDVLLLASVYELLLDDLGEGERGLVEIFCENLEVLNEEVL